MIVPFWGDEPIRLYVARRGRSFLGVCTPFNMAVQGASVEEVQQRMTGMVIVTLKAYEHEPDRDWTPVSADDILTKFRTSRHQVFEFKIGKPLSEDRPIRLFRRPASPSSKAKARAGDDLMGVGALLLALSSWEPVSDVPGDRLDRAA